MSAKIFHDGNDIAFILGLLDAINAENHKSQSPECPNDVNHIIAVAPNIADDPKFDNCEDCDIKLTDAINRIICKDTATIIFWADGTHTTVKCTPDEPFDYEKGIAMATLKYIFGNRYFRDMKKLMDAYPRVETEKYLARKKKKFTQKTASIKTTSKKTTSKKTSSKKTASTTTNKIKSASSTNDNVDTTKITDTTSTT